MADHYRNRRAGSQLKPALGIVVVAFGLRLAYWLVLTPSRVLTSDAGQYHVLATNLAAGRGYVDIYPQLELHATAFRPPVYPFVLSLVYRFTGPAPGVGRALNVVLGTAVVLAAMWLVGKHVSQRAGLAAGLVLAVSPNLIANSTTTLSEPLGLLLLVLLIAALLDERWLLAGLLTGLSVLTRPSAQFLVVVVAVWVFSQVGWKNTARYVAASLLVVAPWIIRNDLRLGSPVLVTSTGYNWAARYSPAAERAGKFVDPIHDEAFTRDRIYQFDEALWNTHLTEIGQDNLRNSPGLLPRTMASNAADLFELAPGENRSAELSDGRHLRARRATLWLFYLTLAAGVDGLVLRREQRLAQLTAMLAIYFTAASLVFMAAPRLRAPVDLMLAIGVGLLVHTMAERRAAPRHQLVSETA